MTAGCHVAAMPTADLDRIRSRGVDVGNAVVVTVNQNEGGEAAVGEHVALVAHQPARVGGPYAEVGPVFIHANSLRRVRPRGVGEVHPRLLARLTSPPRQLRLQPTPRSLLR